MYYDRIRTNAEIGKLQNHDKAVLYMQACKLAGNHDLNLQLLDNDKVMIVSADKTCDQIRIPEFVTDFRFAPSQDDMSYRSTVSWCKGCTFTEIYFDNRNPNVEMCVAGLFQCTEQRTLKIKQFNPIKVKSTAYMFYGCENLKHIDGLDCFDTQKVKNMAFMFQHCSGLEQCSMLKRLDTRSVQSMKGMFRNSQLSETDQLRGWNTSSVRNMEEMFYGCSEVNDFSGLSGWDVCRVQTMEGMFALSGIRDTDFMKNWKTPKLKIVQQMFDRQQLCDAYGFTCLDLSKVTSFERLFINCRNLKSLKQLKTLNLQNIKNTSLMLYYTGISGDFSDIKDWDVSNVEKAEGMFAEVNVEQLNGLENWDTSRMKTMRSMFFRCQLLKDIQAIKDWNTQSVEQTNQMFSESIYIRDISILKNWDLRANKDIRCMFSGLLNTGSASVINSWTLHKTCKKQNVFMWRNPSSPRF